VPVRQPPLRLDFRVRDQVLIVPPVRTVQPPGP
jgi:hypothetical protein